MIAARHDRIERFAGASAGRCEESPTRLHLQSGLSRRAFLKTQAACALGLAAGGVLPAAAAAAGCDIAIAKGEPAAATRAAVAALGGMQAFVHKGARVVLKPNMSFVADVDSAANTHPLVVAELVHLCLEAGAARVRVLDHAFQSGTGSLEASGILAACNGIREGICHNVTQDRLYRECRLTGAREMKSNAVIREVLEADVLIAVPVAKTNSSTGVSLGLKGQMGLIQDRNVMHWRYDLDTAIVDLAAFLRPALTVVDATRVLASNGPYGPGTVLRPGEIIASADPVAADAMTVASYEWYGRRIRPQQVAHIAGAHARGLGRMDIENLQVRRLTV